MNLQPNQTILNGKYRIVRLIGEGEFARVWLAEETEFGGRQVAIREPRRDRLTESEAEEQARRFRQEVDLAALLERYAVPGVIRALTVERLADGTRLLVLEYADGGSLADLIRAHPQGLPAVQAAAIASQIARALDGFHRLPVGAVHRDVKPSNILLTAAGEAKLSDFGLAQLPGASGRSAGAGIGHPGTPNYMAPEQARSPEPLAPMADVFALGCVLFEMLTGKVYKRVRPGTKLRDLRADAPAWLEEVLARALDEDPWSRCESAGEMADALERGQAEAERQRIEADKRMAAAAAAQARTQQEAQRKAEEEAQAVWLAEQERQRRAAEMQVQREAEERARRKAAEPKLTSSEVVAPAAVRKWPVGWIVAVVGLAAVITTWAVTRPEPTPATTAPAAFAAVNRTATSLALAATPAAALASPTAAPMVAAQPTMPVLPTHTTGAPTLIPSATAAPTVTPTIPPIATAGPTAVPTPTPKPQLTVGEATINVRAGPGTVYPVVGLLRRDETREITGKNTTLDWWQIDFDGQQGWVSGQVVQVNPEAGAVGVVAAPPPPIPAPPVSAISVGSIWTSPIDGMVQVLVPAGGFLMGSTDSDPDARGEEKPQHKVTLDAYWIDQTEVTKDQYQKCVAAGRCAVPLCGGAGQGDHPVVCVSWLDASSYCVWAGRRLPTEAEWEKAARGVDGRKYPWGNEAPNCNLLNYYTCVGSSSVVGSYPTGSSPYGALDMAGNVWEWVADWADEKYYARSPAQNPKGPDSGMSRVLRGGSWYSPHGVVRATYRSWFEPDRGGSDGFGFRCARSQ